MEGNAGARLPSISSLSYPTFKPKVILTGMAVHADPEPVLVFDGPYAYQVRVKIPGGTKSLSKLHAPYYHLCIHVTNLSPPLTHS